MTVPRVVVVDSSVLINLLHVEGLSLLRGFEGHEFVLPVEVRDEVCQEPQRQVLVEAIEAGGISLLEIDDPNVQATESELLADMGPGEAACLAAAHHRNYWVATDDRRAIAKAARALLAQGRVISTPALFLLAIKAGTMMVDEADAALRTLEQRRFRTKIRTFRDLA